MDGKNTHFTSEIKVELPLFLEFLKLSIDVTGRNTVFRLLQIGFLLFYMTNMHSGAFMIGFFIMAVLFPLAEWWNRRKYKDGGVAYKQLLYQHEGNIPHQVFRFEEDHVVAHNPRTDNERITPYSQYVRLWESKNLLVMILDVNMYQIIDKRTLTGGTSDELIAFLREKCPNLKKKVAKGRFGRLVRRVLWGIIAIGIVIAALNLLHIPEMLRGQITNGMSYEEMAGELRSLGIEISSVTVEELNQYSEENRMDILSDSTTKAMNLLCWEGQGRFEKNVFYQEGPVEAYDWNWTPSTSGVYWFDLEVMDCTAIYTNFLAGVDAMSEDISFTNVAEDYSNASILEGQGEIGLSFDYLGNHYELTAEYNSDWFDGAMLYELGKILSRDETPKDLWYLCDGQGVLLYYGTEEEAEALERKTDLSFLDPVENRLYS